MRIAFVNRIAWPDEGATAIYVTDVAEACAAAGHEVHVLCGSAEYRAGGGRAEPDAVHEGVRYHRVEGARGAGLWRRAWASRRFISRARRRLRALPCPDVVVALTDPPFLDAAIGRTARRRGARVVHWLMDVYPDVLFAAGVLRRGGAVARILRRRTSLARRRADVVVVLGASMRRPVLASGVARRRLRVIENWAPREVEEAVRTASPRAPADPVTLLYSGNLGRAHDLSILADAVRSLPAGTRLRIVFQASGPGARDVREMFHDAPLKVEWRLPVPRADLPRALLEAQWHVVSVKSGFERLLVPSKTYAPLALGLPLIVLGPAESEPARIVRRTGCGVVWSRAAEAATGLAALASGEVVAPRSGARLLRREEGLRAWVALLAGLASAGTAAGGRGATSR